MVQAAVPDPVAAVLDVVPENIPYSVPDAAALPREPVSVLMSVATAFNVIGRALESRTDTSEGTVEAIVTIN